MILYTHKITPRLRYIVSFVSKEFQVNAVEITCSPEDFAGYNGVKINYSDNRFGQDEIWIKPQGLLFEKEIIKQNILCFETNNHKAFFKTEGDLSFDIFAASFYLLSRYEEYLPHSKDVYGRYAYTNSVAFKEGFLDRPLINIWLEVLKKIIRERFVKFPISKAKVSFSPTYDIDMAWSYRHKGWWRNTGGLLQSLIKGQWALIKERLQVLAGKQKDPFDAFNWMDELHRKYKLNAHYFFLVPRSRGRFDKNISPSSAQMQQLIREHSKLYSIGIHPSWRSGDEISLIKNEIITLSELTGKPVISSRQHYIRFTLPETFRQLIAQGIRYEYSMGYGSINGFRASVASPYYWYDLQKEEQTPLFLYPFCFMEANAFYEQKLSPQEALREMHRYYQEVKSINGHFITIWHNSFLGTARLYAGWREIYEQFIREIMAED